MWEAGASHLLLAGAKEVEKLTSLEAPVQKVNLLSERWRVIYLFCYILFHISFKGTIKQTVMGSMPGVGLDVPVAHFHVLRYSLTSSVPAHSSFPLKDPLILQTSRLL